MADEKERMNLEQVLARLNRAFVLQQRSVLQYTLAAGSVFGFQFQSLAAKFDEFAIAERDDLRRLVEKLTALGGEPATEKAPSILWSTDLREMVDWLVEFENEAIEALQDVIPETGNDGPSEALEHLLEHIIMRKQNQVDLLLRALRGA